MQLKLKILKGSHAGEVLKVTREKFIIGRDEDCHLRPNSDRVARQHCVIQLHAGSATIRDMGSKDGTFVNGERILGEYELKKGDRIEVGPLSFEASFTTDVQGTKRPEVKSVAEAVSRTAGSARDLDIDDWLGEEEPESKKPVAPHDTGVLSTQETVTMSKEESEREEERKRRMEEAAKKNEGDSRDAAADALRKLMKRR